MGLPAVELAGNADMVMNQVISTRRNSADKNETAQVVLVTGASGYVALHCVQQLLAAGFNVRGTVRDKSNQRKILPLQKLADENPNGRLELIEADLLNPQDWPRAMDGCTFVLHVASPWPIVADESTIRTAVEGTLNVLRTAATTPSVKKVVITSSCAAVNDGHRNDSQVFDERCWTNLDNPRIENYARSKTMSELSAWKFWNTLDHNNRFALTVLNPTFIVGPLLSDVPHGSAIIVGRFMDFRTYLASPKVSLGIVDVRDVAKAHLEALRRPESDGERILITARSVWFGEMVYWLRREFIRLGYKISPVVVPNWILKLYASMKVDKQVVAIVHRVGSEVKFDNSKSREILGLVYSDPRSALIRMAHDMINCGMVRMSKKYKKWKASEERKQIDINFNS
ncbi:hypothetical protein KIN20_012001 [Parelaphostrongylus tenuis]|uniref:NAD-dependent epimerase/dehydratase domain-containing protein n=1 Tax=Parelaphostrongylus tenuis TaxID=148309 RepID=A0AAD5QMX3_PARTN|nr:hypothetical protein KIN20_012001 [Parelaphostrongylus tenuis]